MAHSPSEPERFVCLDCQVVHVGTVVHEDDATHYEAPDGCGACGHREFVPYEQYAHHHKHQE